MTYVVNDSCIRCKFQDCVDVCPVEAFAEGENMLVIDPEKCIDCGVCETECGAEAILPDSMAEDKWTELNAKYAKVWPTILEKKEVPEDADDYVSMEGKFQKFFSEKPGTGS